jgi:sugar O-acyltransferase (sialic acid O-acetyltransferase NeuD family)
MKEKLILIGAGGHCRSCIEVIDSLDAFQIEGLLDAGNRVGDDVLGYKIIGGDSIIANLAKENYSFLITLGQVASAIPRKKIYDILLRCNARMATVISPYATVSKHSIVGRGSIIMHQAAVNAGVKIGNNSIINTNAIVEHDVVIGDHCHVSTSATVNGEAVIGSDVFIGSGSVISQNVSIATGVVIGAGTTVHKSITEAGTYAGSSFRKIK